MSKKTLAPSVVTARDSKGRKFMSVVQDAYDLAELPEDEAQLVNEAPGLGEHIAQFINRHRHLKNSPKEKARLWREATKKACVLMGMGEAYDRFANSVVVEDEEGHWTVVMLPEMSCAKIRDAIKQAGSGFWSWSDNLDKVVPTNDRDPTRDGPYAIGVRATIEADEENANKTADMLAKEGHKGMTLMERLMLELIHFLATGQHLDVINWTLCTGSRFVAGGVPGVFFDRVFGKVDVHWYFPGYSRDHLRSRSAASLPVELRVSAAE